ncbi:hypothetical protein KKA24_02355 [Patescibacteria group bacterium]|nr:hypothetical protein [Patescibacteria group bacterium]
MKHKNTLKKGSVRYIIFKEDSVWYGVALEFNIVEEGDSPLEVMASLFQAIEGYVETAQKFKMRPMPLNQKPDKEYQDLWNKLKEGKSKKEVHTFGFTPFKNYASAY